MRREATKLLVDFLKRHETERTIKNVQISIVSGDMYAITCGADTEQITAYQ